MAIIDSHCILFEGPLSAESTGKAVPLTALRLPGRMEPMPLRISVTRGFAKERTTSLDLTLQEADSADGEWQDVPGAAISVPGEELGEGARLGWPRAGCVSSWPRPGAAAMTGMSSRPCCARRTSPTKRNCACASPFERDGTGPS